MADGDAPSHSERAAAHLAQARRLRDARSYQDAEQMCRRALDLDEGDAEAHRVLATVLRRQERLGESIASFRAAIRLDPTLAKTHKQLAEVLAEQGHLDEAVAADRAALQLRPGYVDALAHLAVLKRFRDPDDADLADLESLRDRSVGLGDRERVLVLFALAKAYDDLDDPDRAFACLEQANGLKRATIDYDADAEATYFERIAATFAPDLVNRAPEVGAPSDLPVLIVGMPRSGTSLVEQILSAHPAVRGAGERGYLEELTTLLPILTGRGSYPESVPHVAPADLRSFGAGYAARLRDVAPGASRVTDKAPANFRFLGFARLILPNARVIHVVRDPVDTCLSCFQQNFESQPFAFALDDLGRAYRAYARLMSHWRQVLPDDWLYEVRYEDLVADPALHSRRIVAHCGLDWDDACLRFHESEHVVRTASLAQVRQPIHGRSVGRWRRYERHLAPLLDALAVDGGG